MSSTPFFLRKGRKDQLKTNTDEVHGMEKTH